MIFNSYEFIFLFLPTVAFVFFQVGSESRVSLLLWLVAASLLFYGWWNPIYLWLLIFSLLFNYTVGLAISLPFLVSKIQKALLVSGIAVNLALISYFKYAGFFASTINDMLKTSLTVDVVVLPLGISFFTFQQIAYLVDIAKGKIKEHNFLKYCLFITFFPQLIAGPIVHYKEVVPQLASPSTYRFNPTNVALGTTLFSVGLFKKVILADGIAVYAMPLFNAAAQGSTPTFLEAWSGLIAYSLQLYFDFSGYSDMALGAARIFGIKLPFNFKSPYKATSMIEFWQCWHVTLSRFLKNYIYIPLRHWLRDAYTVSNQDNKKLHHSISTAIVMLLCGLWHGAGWNFILWGGLHGLYLIVNYQWQSFWRCRGYDFSKSHWAIERLNCLITYLAFVASLALFRATNLKAAGAIFTGIVGANGISIPDSFDAVSSRVILLLLIVWLAPNIQELLREDTDVPESGKTKSGDRFRQWWQWQPNYLWAIATSSLAIASVLNLSKVNEFLYFNF